MSTQHGNLPIPERPVGGGHSRKPRPFRLWYRVTYLSTHDGAHSYVIQCGKYHSEEERQRVMDKVLREHSQRSSDKVEFFFEKPAEAATDW